MESSAEAAGGEEGSSSGKAPVSLNNRLYTVLLVEDDPSTAKMICKTLEQCSYKVVLASNGREALDVLEGPQGHTIDVILTDNLMPEVSGIELIYQMVQADRWQHVPVIVMSAESRQEVVAEAFQAGASDFLIKPIRRNELTTLWQHAWRACNTPRTPRAAQPGSPSAHGSAKASHIRFQMPGTSEVARPASPSAAPPLSSSGDGSEPKRAASGGAEAQQPTPKRPRIMDRLTQAASSEEQALSGGARLRSSLQLDKLDDSGGGGSAARSSDASEDTAPGAREQEAACRPLEPSPWQSSLQGVANIMQQLTRGGQGEAAPLEIRPLDVSPMPAARQASLNSLPYRKGPGKQGEEGKGSLEQLHHSGSHSAFSSFTAVVPRPCARGSPEEEGDGSGFASGLAAVLANPQSTLLQQQQSFFQAFQAAMTQHQTATAACAANRKAAIAKFRAKRKSRSFEKKVRYASRQRLAESRPRVRGQFVKADVFAAHTAAAGGNKHVEE